VADFAGYAITAGSTDGWVDDGPTIRLAEITDSVGIGTNSPQSGHQLHVKGLSRFEMGGGSIAMSTPGTHPGMIMFSSGNYRRDLVLTDYEMHLVTSNSSSIPALENGITIAKMISRPYPPHLTK
jgi:hypothetical protein